MRVAFTRQIAVIVLLLTPMTSAFAETEADSASAISGTVTGYYYAMRDQSDFGVGVASLNRGPLHFEARYNYEAMHSTSIFAGWNFSGGETFSFAVTPIVGGLFGDVQGVIPGVEASVAWLRRRLCRSRICPRSGQSQRQLFLRME